MSPMACWPFRFDIGGGPKKPGFGYGVHFCLGAAPPGMEVKSFLAGLLPRLKFTELNGDPQFVATTFVGGLEHLLVPYSLVWAAIGVPRLPRVRVRVVAARLVSHDEGIIC